MCVCVCVLMTKIYEFNLENLETPEKHKGRKTKIIDNLHPEIITVGQFDSCLLSPLCPYACKFALGIFSAIRNIGTEPASLTKQHTTAIFPP